MRAGLYGNLGALLMGAAGRLEDALDYTEKSIEAGKETSIPDASLTAGMHSIFPTQSFAWRCFVRVSGHPASACTTQLAWPHLRVIAGINGP